MASFPLRTTPTQPKLSPVDFVVEFRTTGGKYPTGGIFAALDSASMTEDKDQDKDPHAKDKALLQNLHTAFNKAPFNAGEHKVYGKPNKPTSFTVVHFAGEVHYDIIGFVERVCAELESCNLLYHLSLAV